MHVLAYGLYLLLILGCKPLEDQDFDSTVDGYPPIPRTRYLGTNIQIFVEGINKFKEDESRNLKMVKSISLQPLLSINLRSKS